MSTSQIYIALSIVVLAIVALLIFFTGGKKGKSLTPLAGVAFAFVVAGVAFSDDRMIGYSLLGIGVILAVVDMVRRRKNSVT